MERFVFYLRSPDMPEIDGQRQACHKLAGDSAEVLAVFIEVGEDSKQEFLQALELSSAMGATLVSTAVSKRCMSPLRPAASLTQSAA